MKKDDLKYLVTQMYDKLIDQINDKDEDIEKHELISYLRDSVDVIIDIPETSYSSVESLKSAFDDAYKEIANKSISSYKHTNKRFEALAQMHEETLTSCSNEVINIPEITDKFNDIQTHMIDEVKKANDIIVKLSSQVDKLEKESNVDSLTKVYNRRALTTLLTNVCEKSDTVSDFHLVHS